MSRLAPTPATFLARNSGLALLGLGTLLVALPANKTLFPCSVLATVLLQFNSLPSVAGLALLMTMGPAYLSQLFTHFTSRWRIDQQQQSTERTAPLRRAWRMSRARHGSRSCLVQTQFLQLGFVLSVLTAGVAHGSCILSGTARPGLTFHICPTESHHSS